ncbi:hypothetical protein MBLNU457_g0272t1 [Dothideomycetes sp. NU457]
MVVKVKRHGTNAPSSTDDNMTQSPTMIGSLPNSFTNPPSVFTSNTSHINESDMRTSLALPFYDTSSMPPSELITHLSETFFTHLGCNFPFLQKQRFLKDLEAKQVDAILVDAMCAMAARFSTHPLLVEQTGENGVKLGPSDYGHAFAQRAKNALIDAYAVPGVAAIQAALLLAYNEFGESRDSGLWMYLGIAIRMVQDLGLQKREGLRYEGRDGPAPCTVSSSKSAGRPSVSRVSPVCVSTEAEEIVAIERERVDTFWAVFFLDKVVSSGTGRRSTLLDDDIELSFPSLDSFKSDEGFPSPFPALIRIVHLYGRVADVLNSIKSPTDETPDTPKRLAEMEQQVTQFYQGLSPRLHFEAMNFHHYVKTGSGTSFILLHLWFHTLIILLHQPTLLKTFEGNLKLFPNSQQLSLSSAKTIADMLSYSQLIDTKACLGNPFTTQPIYIAACAFLRETAERSSTSTDSSHSTSRNASQNASRAVSPSRNCEATSSQATNSGTAQDFTTKQSISSRPIASGKVLDKAATKSTLLAKAASQHYQLCYHALESLETYWSGAKYILTVLDQKFKGVGDPLLYTAEEGESSLEQPRPDPVFSSPGWRRKISWAPSLRNHATMRAPFMSSGRSMAGSSKSDHAQAIGWTLTGTMNSPSTNVGWHFPGSAPRPEQKQTPLDVHSWNQIDPKSGQSWHHYSTMSPDSVHPTNTGQRHGSQDSVYQSYSAPGHVNLDHMPSPYQQTRSVPSDMHNQHFTQTPQNNLDYSTYGMANNDVGGMSMADPSQFEDMLIESRDIDASQLVGLDTMSWFDPSFYDMMMPTFDQTSIGGSPQLQHQQGRQPQYPATSQGQR